MAGVDKKLFHLTTREHLGYSKFILKKRAQGDLRRVFLFGLRKSP
jgi:hypothetical protein